MDNEYINWKKCTSRMKRKLVFFSEAQPNLREANFRIQQITYPDGEVVSYTSPASSGGAEMMQNIHYTYDSVSNITDVVNSAPQLSNGLGGDYENHYVYDNLYRLSSGKERDRCCSRRRSQRRRRKIDRNSLLSRDRFFQLLDLRSRRILKIPPNF